MNKAILIMDMPRCCGRCPLAADDPSGSYCTAHDEDYIDIPDTMEGKPDWCPLRELPRTKPISADPYSTFKNDHYNSGWNSCLAEIMR